MNTNQVILHVVDITNKIEVMASIFEYEKEAIRIKVCSFLLLFFTSSYKTFILTTF